MRVVLLILALALAPPGWAQSEKSAGVANNDGNLVLSGRDGKPGQTSKDSLSVLLSREVDVFIFRQKTRGWPQGTAFRTVYGPRTCAPAPQVDAIIQKYSTLYGVDPSLVRSVIRHESGFNPQAVSPKGAQGLMQLMPGTADFMGVRNPFDPEQNIAGGVGYLRYCLDRFGHNVPLAVAAYNAGPERVAKTGTVPAIPETQTYVNNVLGTYQGQGQRQAPGQGQLQPVTPQKGAHMLTPATARKVVAAKPMLQAAAEGQAPPPEKRRPRPKIIEVRYPKASKTLSESRSD